MQGRVTDEELKIAIAEVTMLEHIAVQMSVLMFASLSNARLVDPQDYEKVVFI